MLSELYENDKFFTYKFSLVKKITNEYEDFKNSKRNIEDYYQIKLVKVNLTREKQSFKIVYPGEILTKPIFLVTDRKGHYINDWRTKDLRCTTPIKMRISLICNLFDVDLQTIDYTDPPGPGDVVF